jgi:phospholipid-binding lipoprotein MlaA
MTMRSQILKQISVIMLAFVIVGCATKQNPDPYEGYNRAVFTFNTVTYDYVLSPVTDGYVAVTPEFFRTGTTNFFNNTFEVPRMGNSILQGDVVGVGKHALRLVLNTVFGVLGLFDVAETMGLPSQENTFGMTLAKWGYRDSPYLVLPFWGPSTVRDTIGMVPDYFMNPINIDYYFINPSFINPYVGYGMTAIYGVNSASNFLPQYYNVTEYAIDPYIAVRNAYLQFTNARINEMLNGSPNNHGHALPEKANEQPFPSISGN